jgi:6-phosphogluconolactonase
VAVLTIEADAGALAVAAAEAFTTRIEQTIAEHTNAVVSLTGGQTPRRLYALLADATYPWRARIDWPRVHVFWGDERHVAPDHRDSNFGMARDTLLRHVPVVSRQVHRMRGELPDAAAAAREYDATLRAGFAAAGRRNLTFDLMLLGLGEDAHIASIFPGSALLDSAVDRPGGSGERTPASETARVAAVWADHLKAWRITLTPAAVIDTRAAMVVTAGESKADAVQAALEQSDDVRRWPAQCLRAIDGRVTWIIDRAAASRLRLVPRER